MTPDDTKKVADLMNDLYEMAEGKGAHAGHTLSQVLIRRHDGRLVVRPFRGLRRQPPAGHSRGAGRSRA